MSFKNLNEEQLKKLREVSAKVMGTTEEEIGKIMTDIDNCKEVTLMINEKSEALSFVMYNDTVSSLKNVIKEYKTGEIDNTQLINSTSLIYSALISSLLVLIKILPKNELETYIDQLKEYHNQKFIKKNEP